jgi:hypothetical protein
MNKTADMAQLAKAPQGDDPSYMKKGSSEVDSDSVLTDDGDGDMVQDAAMEQEKAKGLALWEIGDITQPLCRNCKALVDYEWFLHEYGSNFLSTLLLLVCVIACIWMLGTTAQDFFCASSALLV